MTPSPFAYVALLLLLPLTAAAFSLLRPPMATAAVLIGSLMFMPERVNMDLPGLPAMNKFSIAGLCALLAVVVTNGRVLLGAKPGRGVDLFAAVYCLATIGTVKTNPDALTYGPVVLPGLTPNDAVSMVARLLLTVAFPFFLGRALFRTSRDLRALMRFLVLAGLLYVPFILVELRLSPQFHGWVYGFQPSRIAIRGEGFRPVVFMSNGLALVMFLVSTLFAAWAMARNRATILGLSPTVVSIVIGITLLLTKSMAAIAYAVVIGAIMLLGSAKTGLRVALALAILVAAYPSLRIAGYFPTEDLVNLSAQLSQERAQSLKFRFDNEDALAAKALERPWFGWGGWSRPHIYNNRGRDISVADGEWIVRFGSTGAVGWAALLGLMLAPVFGASIKVGRLRDKKHRTLLTSLTLMVAVSAVDLLPNALFSYLPLFLSGCLSGLVSGVSLEEAKGEVASSLRPDDNRSPPAWPGAAAAGGANRWSHQPR